MKYDDASWHYEGDFPPDLPPEAAGTHIGMFVAWALTSGLAGDIHTMDFPEALAALQARAVTPGKWFMANCDEKFTDEDLSEQGNLFARSYYAGDPGKMVKDGYLRDYNDLAGGQSDLYREPDTWEKFEVLQPVIDQRFAAWRLTQTRG